MPLSAQNGTGSVACVWHKATATPEAERGPYTLRTKPWRMMRSRSTPLVTAWPLIAVLMAEATAPPPSTCPNQPQRTEIQRRSCLNSPDTQGEPPHLLLRLLRLESRVGRRRHRLRIRRLALQRTADDCQDHAHRAPLGSPTPRSPPPPPPHYSCPVPTVTSTTRSA